MTRAIDEQPNTTHNGAGPALHDKYGWKHGIVVKGLRKIDFTDTRETDFSFLLRFQQELACELDAVRPVHPVKRAGGQTTITDFGLCQV